MSNRKQVLINLREALEKVCENCCCDFEECKRDGFCVDYTNINQLPTVDAVEVAKIEEVKQEILQVLDSLIDADKPLADWSVNDPSSYYSGKIQAFEVARRLVNAALTDLCGAKMDGDKHE